MRRPAATFRGPFFAMGLLACGLLVALRLCSPAAAGPADAPGQGSALSKAEAAAILKQIFKHRDLTVLRVRQGPPDGVWEILLQTESGTSILYVDRSRRYFFGGPILAVKDLKNLTEASLLAFAGPAADPGAIPLEDALVLGDAGAVNRIIVFLDPECRACEAMLTTMAEVSAERRDTAFYLKLLPGEPGEDSYWKAESIVARGSMELLAASLAGEPIPRPAHPVPQVAENLRLADRLGIRATPSLILPDGTRVEGVLSRDNLLQWIEAGGRKP